MIGVSTPSPRTTAASASIRDIDAICSGAGPSTNANVAVPEGFIVRSTRPRDSARRRRRSAQSGSMSSTTSATRSRSAITGNPPASGSTTATASRA